MGIVVRARGPIDDLLVDSELAQYLGPDGSGLVERGALVTASALDALAPAPGVSGGLSTGILAIGLLLDDSLDSAHDQVLAWMPLELAADKAQARASMLVLLDTALARAIPDAYTVLPDEPPYNIRYLIGHDACRHGECGISCSLFRSERIVFGC